MRAIRPDIEDLAHGSRYLGCPRDERRDITDIAERARLRSIPEHRHGLPSHYAVHEDANHVAVAVADVLILAIDVVWPENDRVQPKHVARRGEIELHRVLLNPGG